MPAYLNPLPDFPGIAEPVRRAVLIRRAEEKLLEIVRSGQAHGTLHACIGQELSAVAFCTLLAPGDVIFSNHRCHGHFLAFTGDLEGLFGEVLGTTAGVCAGIGGSQHLCQGGFYSNGIQGGILPVAAGMALAAKMRAANSVGVVFMGDGTLGQGVVYETFNIISKWQIPLLVVCEDNGWAQSTPKTATLAGDITARASAFGMRVSEDSTADWPLLLENARASVDFVRSTGLPAFHLVRTSRLCAHSRSDDCRDPGEVDRCCQADPINLMAGDDRGALRKWTAICDAMVEQALDTARRAPVLDASALSNPPRPRGHAPSGSQWTAFSPGDFSAGCGERYGVRINAALDGLLSRRPEVVLLGEDIVDPYGGAFKITAGLSTRHPGRVLSTPISEAAMTGLANGLALAGLRPVVEIMFGDFVTLAMDQLVNHAAKFSGMYHGKASCPLIMRMPMGGHRGYGPTHSQTLDKLLAGIDGVTVLALNTLLEPSEIYDSVAANESGPVLVIENKTDYTRRLGHVAPSMFANYRFTRSGAPYPTLRAQPAATPPDATLVTYGGAVATAFEAAGILFQEHEILLEVVVPTSLRPLDADSLIRAVSTARVFTLEEGSAPMGIGAEILAILAEKGARLEKVGRIAAREGIIPAARHLEHFVLPSPRTVVDRILEAFHER
ncbi:MAG: Pyruvate dehydrogenase [Desulfovibrionaceae bacterium]|nr:MAG: Pyruvate dehydrogenase [Desulfovibrionaceae bacterium]